MHVNEFLHKLLSSVMHQKRLATLSLLVGSALMNKKLSVTHLGRGIEGKMQERSGIRRSDRFIGNHHLHQEKKGIYAQIIQRLIGNKEQPKIIVDWSPIPNTKLYVLRAALVAVGRALTLYEEVHSEKKQNNTKVQNTFLKTLSSLLPTDCHPILVTDAGFHIPWFEQVSRLGWYYVGRIRNGYTYSADGGSLWQACKSLFKKATLTEQSLGEVLLSKSKFLTTLYYVKDKAKGRHAKTKAGKKQRRSKSKKYSKSAREPWVLCSSLGGKSYLCARRVVKIYRQRMQIEEGFRDLKSSRYGLGFEEAFSRSKQRIENLLLVAMLTSLIAWLVGWLGENKGEHRCFQCNSLKTKRVLSLFFLGCQMIKRKIQIDVKALLACIDRGICYAG